MPLNEQQGVAVFLRNADNTATWLLPLFHEGKKREKVEGFDDDFRPLNGDLLEMISGAAHTNETLTEAAIRECAEERGLGGIVLSDRLPVDLQVYQEREGQAVTFAVSMFMLQLSHEQQEALQQQSPVLEIKDANLVSLLQTMGEQPFRPLAWAMLQMAAKENLWKS